MLAGHAVTSKTGRYKMFPIIGGAVMAVGMCLLTGLSVTTTRLGDRASTSWSSASAWACLMQMVSLIAQNSVELKDMGVATSARMFFQQMGGSLGVAAFGAVFASRLNCGDEPRRARRLSSTSPAASLDPAHGDVSLPPAVRQVVFSAVAHAVQERVLWAVLPASIVVFVLALFIKEVPLRGRRAGRGAARPRGRRR